MQDEYQVCQDGRWFYITENMLPDYINLPDIIIYKISKEPIRSPASPIYNPPVTVVNSSD